MAIQGTTPSVGGQQSTTAGNVKDYFRFHRVHHHLSDAFGPGGFGQATAARETDKLAELLEANTRLTEHVQQLAARIDTLTREIHGRIVVS